MNRTKIPRTAARRSAASRARQLARRARHGVSNRPATLASLAVAAVIALAAPAPGADPARDAAADGIELAATCDAQFAAARDGWSGCIARQLSAARADAITAAGVHFHAWRLAERAARLGADDTAIPVRDAHRVPLQAALRDNRTSLHRLCAAAGDDCAAVGEALEAPTGVGDLSLRTGSSG